MFADQRLLFFIEQKDGYADGIRKGSQFEQRGVDFSFEILFIHTDEVGRNFRNQFLSIDLYNIFPQFRGKYFFDKESKINSDEKQTDAYGIIGCIDGSG